MIYYHCEVLALSFLSVCLSLQMDSTAFLVGLGIDVGCLKMSITIFLICSLILLLFKFLLRQLIFLLKLSFQWCLMPFICINIYAWSISILLGKDCCWCIDYLFTKLNWVHMSLYVRVFTLKQSTPWHSIIGVKEEMHYMDKLNWINCEWDSNRSYVSL